MDHTQLVEHGSGLVSQRTQLFSRYGGWVTMEYKVQLSSDCVTENREKIVEWLNHGVGEDNWFKTAGVTNPITFQTSVLFWFKYEPDALLFRLRWQ